MTQELSTQQTVERLGRIIPGSAPARSCTPAIAGITSRSTVLVVRVDLPHDVEGVV